MLGYFWSLIEKLNDPEIDGRTQEKRQAMNLPFERFPGSDLLSRGVAPEVSSALKGLTTVFGMGTGGSPSL